MGKNFFLIDFDKVVGMDVALAYAPWFFGHKLICTFHLKPNFDVSTENYHILLVWVKFSFHSLALEGAKYKLSHSLGEVLLYIWSNEQSFYPNDKALHPLGLKRADPAQHLGLDL